jgi:hypothetical protein
MTDPEVLKIITKFFPLKDLIEKPSKNYCKFFEIKV